MLHDRPGQRCWACTINLERRYPPHWYGNKIVGRYEMYERVVEWVETRDRKEFTRSDCWTSLGRGPAMYGIVRLAFADMVLHGILECTQRRKDGACLAFKVRDGIRRSSDLV